jgi:hypothetical protein
MISTLPASTFTAGASFGSVNGSGFLFTTLLYKMFSACSSLNCQYSKA